MELAAQRKRKSLLRTELEWLHRGARAVSYTHLETPEQFLAIIDQADEEKKSVDERLADVEEAKEDQVKILAVTSCPVSYTHLQPRTGKRQL